MYCLNGICIHLEVLAVKGCCDVCLFTPIVFILKVFLLLLLGFISLWKMMKETTRSSWTLLFTGQIYFLLIFAILKSQYTVFNYIPLCNWEFSRGKQIILRVPKSILKSVQEKWIWINHRPFRLLSLWIGTLNSRFFAADVPCSPQTGFLHTFPFILM